MTEKDEFYMRRCFELARKGLGLTRTNPLVGCLLVHNHRIIGEGYHHEFGGPHAEVNAIRSVKDPELLKEATLYSNLEPCSHQGKTPPCTLLISRKGIRRVVVSNLDPFPGVNGKGVQYLKDAGIQVDTGCLEKEGWFLNRRFMVYQLGKRPYVILKWAQTTDGYIDLDREPDVPSGINWIGNEVSRTLVHKWRAEEAAIMVGTNTVLRDNPRLNVRRWAGENPVRITLDRRGRLTDSCHILDGMQDTLIFTGDTGKYSGRTRSIQADPSFYLEDLLEELRNQKILSLLVEGGAQLHSSFIRNNLWDEARVFTGKMAFSQGVRAPALPHSTEEFYNFGDTKLERFLN